MRFRLGGRIGLTARRITTISVTRFRSLSTRYRTGCPYRSSSGAERQWWGSLSWIVSTSQSPRYP